MHFTLEKHKFFPVVAWSLIIGFAFFSYTLTTRLSEATNGLEAKTQHTVSALEE